MKLETLVKDRQQRSFESLTSKRVLWTELENIFLGNLSDKISIDSKSRVFDHKLSTYILESEARVMAQIPVGKVKNISKNDALSAALMNLILEKYIIPNANAQFPLLVKLRMLHRMSKLYGNAFAFVDWDIKRNGYMGPDLFLLKIWDVFPQVGAVSLDDSDYITVRTYRTLDEIKQLGKRKNYKNIDKVVTELRDKSGTKDKQDRDNESVRETSEYPDKQPAKGKGYFEIFTMFERDRWVDYVADANTVIRETKNPNDDGELPVINKYGIPLVDDIMGTGDGERGRSMQYVINSTWNLALDSAKYSIFPPVVFNQDVIVKSSIKRKPGANWLVRGNVDQAARPIQLSPQGVQTFQNVFNSANASLLNMFGTTDTSVSSQTDVAFGKTPEALKQQSARENSRDNWDKFYMELALTQIMKKFVNMTAKKQTGSLQVRMFEDEVKDLIAKYPEMQEMYDDKKGIIKINKKHTGSTLYDWEIVSGSSFAVDKQAQQDNLLRFLDVLGKYPFFLQGLQQEGTMLSFTEYAKRFLADNTEDWDKILLTQDNPSAQKDTQDEQMLDQHAQEFQQALEQMMQGGDMSMQDPMMQGIPQGGMPQMPAQQIPVQQNPYGQG